MAIKKTEAGWQVDIQPGGRGGKRFRKKFPTKVEALQFERFIQGKIIQQPEWRPEKPDKRPLSDLVKLWFDHHGIGLKSAGDTYKRLTALCNYIGDPPATAFTSETFVEYRSRRLAEGTKVATLNREQATLSAVFSELSRIGKWSGRNPLAKVRKLRVDERELSYLTLEQIGLLLDECRASTNPDTYHVVRICLATGCRWSEGEGLHVRDMSRDPSAVTFRGTKSGRVRVIPVALPLVEEILDSRPKKAGSLFRSCYSAFREAVERSGIKLPEGQMSHVLRHTFASHFMMNGGNILALQRILGHANLTMTMRYAHLAPDHLREVLELNPLTRLTLR